MWNPTDGGVYDFITAPAVVRQRVWPRGIARLADDPWAAALLAQHADTIYDRYRDDPDWSPFFVEVDRLRQAMVDASGCSMKDLVADYVWVRLGDLMSLSFCAGWSDEQRFDRWRVRHVDSHVTVSPDIFGAGTIPFRIDAREISADPYCCEAELQAAWVEAASVTLSGDVASVPQ